MLASLNEILIMLAALTNRDTPPTPFVAKPGKEVFYSLQTYHRNLQLTSAIDDHPWYTL